jgi:hypothetical protein
VFGGRVGSSAATHTPPACCCCCCSPLHPPQAPPPRQHSAAHLRCCSPARAVRASGHRAGAAALLTPPGCLQTFPAPPWCGPQCTSRAGACPARMSNAWAAVPMSRASGRQCSSPPLAPMWRSKRPPCQTLLSGPLRLRLLLPLGLTKPCRQVLQLLPLLLLYIPPFPLPIPPQSLTLTIMSS